MIGPGDGFAGGLLKCKSPVRIRCRLGPQPLIKPLPNKSIVVQMGISRIDTLDFRELTAAECLLRIQAPDALENSLPPQNFVQARNASRKIVGSIEEGCVAIGDLRSCPQEIS